MEEFENSSMPEEVARAAVNGIKELVRTGVLEVKASPDKEDIADRSRDPDDGPDDSEIVRL